MKAEIKDLKINPHRKLTDSIKNRLIKIMEEQFQNQRALYQEQEQQQEAKIIEQWKKEKGYNRIMTRLEKAEADYQAIKKEAEARIDCARERCKTIRQEMENKTAFYSSESQVYSWHNNVSDEAKQTAKELEERLKKAIKRTDATALKQKLIARLLVAETIGEALVIVGSVLGNDVFPIPTLKQLEAPNGKDNN